MFTFSPVRILLLAAVLPGLFLLFKIYRMDKIEKEPPGLLLKCFFFGVISIISALILESAGMWLMDMIFTYYSLFYEIVLNFIVIAGTEELCKYFFLKKATWLHPEFNYRFDAVIYAVFVSLGFAIFENINYVLSYGLATAIIRAITAVPAHAIFAIFMGHYYGQAKLYFEAGRDDMAAQYRKLACIVPILMHGFYDFAASSNSGLMTAVFWIFLIFLYVISIRQINRDAKEDVPLY
ncbi:MAG: PrsW family intramembrane metalloprotease [Lachnospiraceae bacterium]|nr:PrsW family intramembrane metalloprotease [Lachnospiraceae bacterium]